MINLIPIVFATLSGNTTNTIKLNVVTRRTVEKGESTFVDTTVAVELAES